MRNKRNQFSVETLEVRDMLTVVLGGRNYDPPPLGEEVSYVAPPQAGFAPIALPDGIVPPGTTELPPPASGTPAGLPELSNLSETFATTLAVGFMRTHDGATGDVDVTSNRNSYIVSIEVRDGADFFRYVVDESAAQINGRYVVRAGAHSEILASAELVGPLDGGLVYAQFDDDVLTAMAVHSEIAGTVNVWTYPEALSFSALSSGGPGLSSPEDLAGLDALVEAHLDGPAAGIALDNFRAAVDDS